MEDIWTMNCDLCKRVKLEGESWSWWDGHLSFTFCPECEKNRDSECVKVMVEAESENIKRSREYWETHPEELAEHNRETERYRATLDADGYPMDFSRPWRKKVWNWFCRQVGWTKYDRHGKPTGYRIWTD